MTQGEVDDEATTAANSLTGLSGMVDAEVDGNTGTANDAATLNSDAAVTSVGGGSGGEKAAVSTSIPPAVQQPPQAAGHGEGGSGTNNPPQPRRKRALSFANESSGTIETSTSMTAAQGQQNNNSTTASTTNQLMHQNTIGSNIMGSINGNSGVGDSIVSFGLNFHFDSTSSPSNSDSGEGAVNGSNGGEGSSEDDNNGNSNNTNDNNNNNKGIPGKIIGIKHHHKSTKKSNTSGSNEGKNSKGSSSSTSKKNSKSSSSGSKKQNKVKFDPKMANGKEGSGSSTSSSENDNNDSGGSASSNSGNDGSSGGKSTISSLTTSSNQEWVATNESAAAAAGKGGENKSSGEGNTVGEKNASDGKDEANKKKDPPNKKRKAVSKPVTNNKGKGNEKGNEGGNEEDDGYKTEEEQWGNNRNADGSNQVSANGPLPGGPMGTHKNNGLASLLRASSVTSSKKSNGSNEGRPPAKQARFSLDHEHPTDAIRSVDASSQPLSSLSGSDSAGVPVTATNNGLMINALPNSSGIAMVSNPSSSAGGPKSQQAKPGTKRKASATTDSDKRKERNAREKERSCRIARQIDDLRTLLSRGGVIVSKGTKSSVLAEAANYINLLQQQQVQWEMDKQIMLQQMQQIGVTPNATMGHQGIDMSMGASGLGIDAQAAAVQQAIAQQQMPLGVQGLPGQGNGILPMNNAALAQPGAAQATATGPTNSNDYQFIFNNSSVGMAIASLGGAFVDCNSIFCQLSEFTKEEICAMTIFNMTSRQDLQHAFDLISQMITPALTGAPTDTTKGREDKSQSIVLRGAMKNRTDLGLSISLIKGENGIAKCFCVTLVRILSMDTTNPGTVSIEMELPQVRATKQQKSITGLGLPTYTSG